MPRTTNPIPYGGRRETAFEPFSPTSHDPRTCKVISLQQIAQHLDVAFPTAKVWAYQRTIGYPPRHILPPADHDRFFSCEVCDHYHQGWYGCNIQKWAKLPDGNGKNRAWLGPDYLTPHYDIETVAAQPSLDPFAVPPAA